MFTLLCPIYVHISCSLQYMATCKMSQFKSVQLNSFCIVIVVFFYPFFLHFLHIFFLCFSFSNLVGAPRPAPCAMHGRQVACVGLLAVYSNPRCAGRVLRSAVWPKRLCFSAARWYGYISYDMMNIVICAQGAYLLNEPPNFGWSLRRSLVVFVFAHNFPLFAYVIVPF